MVGFIPKETYIIAPDMRQSVAAYEGLDLANISIEANAHSCNARPSSPLVRNPWQYEWSNNTTSLEDTICGG